MTWVSKKMHQSMCRLLKIWKTNKRAGARQNISIDKDEEDGIAPLQLPGSGMPQDIAVDVKRMLELIKRLPARLREILEARMDGKILEEIAEEMGLTRERVRQLESKASDRLRVLIVRDRSRKKTHAPKLDAEPSGVAKKKPAATRPLCAPGPIPVDESFSQWRQRRAAQEAPSRKHT